MRRRTAQVQPKPPAGTRPTSCRTAGCDGTANTDAPTVSNRRTSTAYRTQCLRRSIASRGPPAVGRGWPPLLSQDEPEDPRLVLPRLPAGADRQLPRWRRLLPATRSPRHSRCRPSWRSARACRPSRRSAADTGSRIGQHDARPVIAGKNQWPLDRTGGNHHLLRPHMPQPFARQARFRIRMMIRDPFDQADEIVREPTERRGARQQRDVRMPAESVQCLPEPCRSRPAVDVGSRLCQQRPSGLRLLIAQHDARTARRGGKRCRQPGGTGADHEHVAMCIMVQIAIGIRRNRRLTEPGGGTDRWARTRGARTSAAT